MSTKYKFVDNKAVYFTTSTVVGWSDVFTRDIYRDIVLDSIKLCQLSQWLNIHAWVLITNHFHTICSCGKERTGSNMEEYEKQHCHETDRCHHQQPERKQAGQFAAYL